ncbi:MAG TPA: pitrilysin family protein [Candidatus Paceibacterota bacterium]|nr:pitrilysin family protein [Candidatus Paceibacterota bacterium]
MAKDFTSYKLDNGMEIILVPRKESPATTVMVAVKVGSKYETKEISGLSHFLEHMTFKGTEKRPGASTIATELDGLGASYNAFTGQERTAYYAKVQNKHFDKVFNIVSDLYLNSTLPADEMEKERGVIIEEINMYEDMPMRKVSDDFLKVLYGDQPAGWSIAGRKEVIKNIERENFVQYRNKHYKPSNTILAIAGGYDDKNLKKSIKKIFGKAKKDSTPKLPRVKENQEKPNEFVRYKDSDQAHLILGFRAFDTHDERKFALWVLSNILGGNMSSRLFKKIRDDMGAAYYIHSNTSLDTNCGVIQAKAGVSTDKTEKVIKAILNEFRKIKEEAVGAKELDKAKRNIIGNMYLGLETSNRLAGFYINQRVKNLDLTSPDALAERINNVTPDDVQSVAKDLFHNSKLNLAVIGPFKNKSFLDILKI